MSSETEVIEYYSTEESTRMSRPIIAIFKGERPIGSVTFEEGDVTKVEDIKKLIKEWNERLKADNL